MPDSRSRLASLPSVESVLALTRETASTQSFASGVLSDAIRGEVDRLRSALLEGEEVPEEALEAKAVLVSAERGLETLASPQLRVVVNATGVVLHTNLGRAVLAEEAALAAYQAGRSAVDLEFDLSAGRRGERDHAVEEHVCALTGAEAATVVNNNAAAVLLALATVARGRDVIVSRGELVEIGGAFRIPEVMTAAGARLKEVGTTNRTHPRDYAGAIDEKTGALLKVHTSNYQVLGFTASVDVAALSELAHPHGLPVVEDLGSGALVDTTAFGLPREPSPRASIEAGASIVTFSGDKLLGGPQCGILAGSKRWIDAARSNPLKRALRLDKMTLAALERTLSIVRFAPDPVNLLPSLRALARTRDSMRDLAERAAAGLREALGSTATVSIVETEAQVGSGAQPTVTLPSLALSVALADRSADQVARAFRLAQRPIVGRVEKDRFLLDLRLIEDPDLLLPRWEAGLP